MIYMTENTPNGLQIIFFARRTGEGVFNAQAVLEAVEVSIICLLFYWVFSVWDMNYMNCVILYFSCWLSNMLTICDCGCKNQNIWQIIYAFI